MNIYWKIIEPIFDNCRMKFRTKMRGFSSLNLNLKNKLLNFLKSKEENCENNHKRMILIES